MDAFLDMLWLKILSVIHGGAALMDFLLAPLNAVGPSFAILVTVLATVLTTKVLGRVFKTRRYVQLQKEFLHWYNLRQEALACDDKEKGKALAKNIDQARLNKVYYDYFFEGLLNNIITQYLPVLTMLTYVSETYNPDRLRETFGRGHLFQFQGWGGDTVTVGALLLFVVALFATYAAWSICARLYRRRKGLPVPVTA